MFRTRTTGRTGFGPPSILYIQNGSSWHPLEAEKLVEAVLHGELHHDTVARDEARRGRVGSLEQLLRAEHYRILSRRLVEEVHRLYAGGVPGLTELEQRVSDLAEWEWPRPRGRRLLLRLRWLSAWLAELSGKEQTALERYAAFLRLKPGRAEPGLALLARNNQAVLRLRTGDLAGLPALTGAALGAGLPAACFGLLNVLNLAHRQGWFGEIDPTVTNALNRLGPDERRYWVGPEGLDAESTDSPAAARNGDTGTPLPAPSRQPVQSLRRQPQLLRKLLLRLLEHAADIETAGATAAQELHIWALPRPLLVAGEGRPGDGGHAAYAEAATLLYPRDLPDSLSRPTTPPSPDEVLAESEIAEARKYLDEGEHGPACQALASAQALLDSQTGPGPRTPRLRKEVERLTHAVQALQDERRALTFQNELGELRRQVDEICRLERLAAVQQRRPLLARRMARLRELYGQLFPARPGDLTEALQQRVDDCLARLEQREREEGLREPYQRLQHLLPDDLTKPVSAEAREALRLCRLADPEGKAQDWEAIRRGLVQHDARHYLHQAWRAACDRKTRDPRTIEGLLVRGLALEAGLAAYAAPLLALVYLPQEETEADNFDEVRQELTARADRLLREQILGGDPLLPPEVRQDVIAEALLCLRRVVEVLQARRQDERAVEDMTRILWAVFRPVLRGGRPQDLDVVANIFAEWKTVCRTWFDPRHPIRAAEADVAVSRLIAQALQHHEKGEGAAARPLLEQAFEHGLRDQEQAQKAAWLLALALPLEGSPQEQGHILGELEKWVATLPDEAIARLRTVDVTRQVQQIRDGFGAGPDIAEEKEGPEVCPRDAPGIDAAGADRPPPKEVRP